MNTIKISIPTISKDETDILVAILSNIQYNAFEEEENVLNAYIPERDWDEDILVDVLDANFSYRKELIPHQNWNETWEKSYEPIIIKDIIGIRASFHKPLENVATEIIITPKMSFGTGHHPTTYLMLEAIHLLDCQNKRVLDYGCGTGVLGIYASMRGANKVHGLDIETWCIENTQENAELNGIANFTTSVGDLDSLDDSETFDIILANINLHILIKNMPLLKQKLKKGGSLLLSGFMQPDLEILQETIKINEMISTRTAFQLNWCMLHITK